MHRTIKRAEVKDIFDTISKIVELSKDSRPLWFNKNELKYLNITIDTRDGMCAIRDRNGTPITLEELNDEIGKEKAKHGQNSNP